MHLPLFAVGASSGGNFVAPFADFVNTDSRLAGLGMHVQAIDVQIATFLSIPKVMCREKQILNITYREIFEKK